MTSVQGTPIDVAWIQTGTPWSSNQPSSVKSQDTTQVYYEYQVDEPVSVLSWGTSEYADSVGPRTVSGEAVLQYVVDTTGRVEPGSVRVLRTSNPGIVREAIARLHGERLTPAFRQGRRVRQLAEQAVVFARTDRPPTDIRRETMFTDSTIYRARCKEADTIQKLAPIPRACTLRDQRLEIR